MEDLLRLRPDLAQALRHPLAEENRRLAQELDRHRSQNALQARRQTIDRLLKAAGLPAVDAHSAWARAVVSEAFVDSLMSAESDADVRRLIEERAALLRGAACFDLSPGETAGLCRSREQRLVSPWSDAPRDAREFAAALLRP